MSNLEKHKCYLKVKLQKCDLPSLAPNATGWAEFQRRIKKLLILDVNSRYAKAFFATQSTMRQELKRHAISPFYYVIHPFSKLNAFVRVLFFIVWTWRYITLPAYFMAPFELCPFLSFVDDYVVIEFQILVMVMFFFIGYVDHKKNQISIKPREIAVHYLKTYFVFDFIVVLYAFFNKFLQTEIMRNHICFVSFVAGSVISYGIRFRTVVNIVKDLTISLRVGKVLRAVLVHGFLLIFVIHWLTCFTYFVSRITYRDNYPAESWFVQAKIHDINNTPFLKVYSECLMVVLCYFFGAAHGMYEVTMPNEQFMLFCLCFTGRLYTLFLIADLLHLFGVVNLSASKYESYLSQLNEYMNFKKLPEHLKSRLRQYYEYKLQKQYFNEQEIMSTLTEQLKIEVFLHGAKRLFQKIPVLLTLNKASIGRMVANMKAETFLPGDVIVKAGDNLEYVYFISSGTVAVLDQKGAELCHLEDGNEFGVVSLWTPRNTKHIFSHVALENSEIYYMDKNFFIDFVEEQPEIFKYFETRVQDNIAKYKIAQKNIRRGGTDLLSELKRGLLLEKSKVRSFAFFD